MQTWVRIKKPTTCKQAGELADEYIQTRQTGTSTAIRAQVGISRIRNAVSCAIRLDILQRTVQIPARMMRVVRMILRHVRVWN